MMLKLPFGIGGIAYGGLIQILCSVGMHHTVTPIIVSIFTETGVDYINPMGSCSNRRTAWSRTCNCHDAEE